MESAVAGTTAPPPGGPPPPFSKWKIRISRRQKWRGVETPSSSHSLIHIALNSLFCGATLLLSRRRGVHSCEDSERAPLAASQRSGDSCAIFEAAAASIWRRREPRGPLLSRLPSTVCRGKFPLLLAAQRHRVLARLLPRVAFPRNSAPPPHAAPQAVLDIMWDTQ